MEKDRFENHEQQLLQQVGERVLASIDMQVIAQPEVAEGIRELREAQSRHSHDVPELVSHNRDLFEAARIRLLQEQGFEVSVKDAEEESEMRRQKELADIHSTLKGKETEVELLQKFHLLNKDGQLTPESINSPLFRKRTSMAFTSYLSAVKSHMDMVDYMQVSGYGGDGADAMAADQVRSRAHDRVAQEVAEDLNIEFDKARRLVAKMRDEIIPRGSENQTYADASLRIGQALSARYANRASLMMKDKTKAIFTDPEDRRK